MKTSPIYLTTLTLALFLTCVTAAAQETGSTKEPPRLILEVDLQVISIDSFQAHTFSDTPKTQTPDNLTTNIVRAKKLFKQMTSLKLRKNQKIRANIGKSNYSFQYIYSL